MENNTTLTLSNKTRDTLMKIKYELGYDTVEEVITSLIEISRKVERANALASSTKNKGGSTI
jgi:hypothetical protein